MWRKPPGGLRHVVAHLSVEVADLPSCFPAQKAMRCAGCLFYEQCHGGAGLAGMTSTFQLSMPWSRNTLPAGLGELLAVMKPSWIGAPLWEKSGCMGPSPTILKKLSPRTPARVILKRPARGRYTTLARSHSLLAAVQ